MARVGERMAWQPRDKRGKRDAVATDHWQQIVESARFREQKTQERMARTRNLLESLNHAAASVVLPRKELSALDNAAIVCQKYVRAKLARKEFAIRLYKRFIEEEEERELKQQQQMAEGETILELRRLEREVEEQATVLSNKQRRGNDAACKIQRAWRRFKGYEYSEYDDWDSIRLNPFSSVVAVETTSAFASPRGDGALEEADSHRDVYGSRSKVGMSIEVCSAAAAQALRPYADDDWDMTPVQDEEPLQIAHIQAQLLAMQEMQDTIDDLVPASLGRTMDESDASEEYDEDQEDYDDDEYAEEGSDDCQEEELEKEEEEEQDESREESDMEQAYVRRMPRKKSVSEADVRSPGADSTQHSRIERRLSRGDSFHRSAIQSHSVGDLYQICYDSEDSRRKVSRSDSNDSRSSFFRDLRRSPEGSSGQPTPTHETLTAAADDRDHVVRADLKLQLSSLPSHSTSFDETQRSPVAGASHPSTSKSAPSATTSHTDSRRPLANLVSTARQYETVVLPSKWLQRTLTEAHLSRLTPIQLKCIANEFHMLVNISSDELVRQLELRDELVTTRDDLNAQCSNLAKNQQTLVSPTHKVQQSPKTSSSSRKRFGFFSKRS